MRRSHDRPSSFRGGMGYFYDCQGCGSGPEGGVMTLAPYMKQPFFVTDAWQPIETAPKDYSAIILYDPEYDAEYPFEGFFDADVEMGGSGDWVNATATRHPCSPTHWHPMPQPPVGAA